MRLRLLVFDADYELIESKGVIKLFCKDENGKTVLVLDKNFIPYFYAKPKKDKIEVLKEKIENLDTSKINAKILKVEKVEKIFGSEKTELIKIILDNPRKIPDVREVIKEWEEVEETFEYDIVFYKRYLLDKFIEPMNWIEVEGREIEKKNYQVEKIIEAESIKPIKFEKEVKFKILAFDTEWVEENGKDKLIMLSLVGNDEYKKVLTCYKWDEKPEYVECLSNEKEIIEKFIKIVKERDPDFLVGYNSDNFDFPKIKRKSEEFGISLKLGRDLSPLRTVRRGRISSTKIKGRVHIDLFVFIDHILSANLKSEILTLDEVAQELLGEGKKGMEYKEMVELWSKKEQLEKLAEYSLRDSELTLKLGKNILPQIFAISRITGLLPFDASRNTYSQLVEAFYMRKAIEDNVLIPNRPKIEEIEKRRLAPVYKGAIVIEPEKGIHNDILVFDFRSLYPTIIVSHNISPETFSCEHKECKEKNKVPETKWHFCIKNEGFIPRHIRKLIEIRKRIKEKLKRVEKDSSEFIQLNNLSQAIKTIANASYGYFGFVGARWYKRECGASAAAFGRYYIKKIIEIAKKEGFKVIYGDTDSCFLKLL